MKITPENKYTVLLLGGGITGIIALLILLVRTFIAPSIPSGIVSNILIIGIILTSIGFVMWLAKRKS